MGNKEALPRGCVQYLSAGTGITHSVGPYLQFACLQRLSSVKFPQSFGSIKAMRTCMHETGVVHAICMT